MPLPNYTKLMPSILKLLSDRNERTTPEVYEHIYQAFNLTEEEKKLRQPSGQDILITNRIRWALKYLKEAKAIESPSRGIYHITDRGEGLLKKHPDEITQKILSEYNEYREFRKIIDHVEKSKDLKNEGGQEPIDVAITPDEMIENGYMSIREEVGNELLNRILQNPPAFFEKMVLDLLTAMDYGQGEVTGKSGDGGIDGYISQDKLGLDRIYFQAKRYKNSVPANELREFVGSLESKGVNKGVFITTGKLPSDVSKIVGKSTKNIVFIDGVGLVNHLMDFDVGVSTQRRYEIKEIDSDYFAL